MTRSTRLWFATFSALVFALGLLSGLVLDRTWLAPREFRDSFAGPGPPPGPPPGAGTPADAAAANVDRLDRELHLSDVQRRDLVALFEAWDTRMRRAQDAVQQQFRDEQQSLRADVMAHLTPAQIARFNEIGPRLLPPVPGRGGRGGPGGRGPGRGRGDRPPPPPGRGE